MMAFQYRKDYVGAVLAFLAAGLFELLPTPAGLTSVGQATVSILILSVIFWIFDVLGSAVTALFMLALLILAGVKPEHALGAYAGGSFWILVGVLFYGAAMQSTGLARRVAYWILNLFPSTYKGVLGAFLLIGLVLSLAIPSMTVRTAILVPIAWALVQTLGLPHRSRGSALLMLSTVEMAVVPGCATLYGSLYGPLMVQLFQTQGFPIEWWAYARVLAVPTIIWSVLLLAGNWIALRPEQELQVGQEFVRSELKKMGPMRFQEMVTAGVVIVSIVYWVTDRWHHQPAFLIGMLGMAVFAAFDILQEKDFGTAISWPLVLFLGALLGLPTVVQQTQVDQWLAGYIVPLIQSVSGNTWLLFMVVAIGMYAARFLDPVGFLAVTVLFLPISSLLRGTPIAPLVLTAVILLPAHPFWVNYQNIWVALGDGITSQNAFDGSHRLRLAHVYAVATLLALSVAMLYWKALGLL